MQLNSDQWDVREKGHMTYLGNFSKKELTFLLLHLSHRLECRSNGWSSSNPVGYAVKATFWEWQGNRIEKLGFLLIMEMPYQSKAAYFWISFIWEWCKLLPYVFCHSQQNSVFIAWLLIWATLSHELILSNQPC